MGAFLSSSGKKDTASAMSKAAKYLRGFLALLVVPCLIAIVLFGVVLLIVGLVVGATSHWSGILVGGVLFIASVVSAVVFWDLWSSVALGLSVFELASCPKEELVMKLKKYNESNSRGGDTGAAADVAIGTMCGEVADTILSKFQMALQWAPLLFTAVSVICCALAVVVEDVPKALLITSIIAVVFGTLASIFGTLLLCCIINPLVEGQVKAAIDPYVLSLQKKLEDASAVDATQTPVGATMAEP